MLEIVTYYVTIVRVYLWGKGYLGGKVCHVIRDKRAGAMLRLCSSRQAAGKSGVREPDLPLGRGLRGRPACWERRAALVGEAFGQVEEVFVTVKAAAVAVAKVEADRVVAHLLPAGDFYVGVVRALGAAVQLAEDVAFAALLGAGGGGAEFVDREVGLGAVAPGDGDFVSDQLDVSRRLHGRQREPTCSRFASGVILTYWNAIISSGR